MTAGLGRHRPERFSYSLFVWQPIEQARTVTFTLMVAAQLVHA